MVQPARLEAKKIRPLFRRLCSPLHSLLPTMLPACRGRPALRRPAQDPASPGPEPALAPVPAPNNDLFQEFMWTCIERVRNQVPAAPAALAAPAAEARDDTDRSLKPQNPDLYYGHLHMECYYFYQQCKDYFEVAGLLGHKCVSFAAGFLKDRILNRWQQHKTRMQRNRLTPVTWDEFKAFLRKSLGESNAFIGHVWSKLRGDAEHQLEEVQDCAAHLEYFQSILLEFDTNNTPGEGQLG